MNYLALMHLLALPSGLAFVLPRDLALSFLSLPSFPLLKSHNPCFPTAYRLQPCFSTETETFNTASIVRSTCPIILLPPSNHYSTIPPLSRSSHSDGSRDHETKFWLGAASSYQRITCSCGTSMSTSHSHPARHFFGGCDDLL